jgi:hypothetical protein
MMKRFGYHFSLVLFLLNASCAAQQSGNFSSGDLYHENLALVRPSYEADPADSSIKATEKIVSTENMAAAYTVNTKVDKVLDSLDKLNQLKKFVDGFTIQIYSGPNREDALSTKSKMVREMSDLEASIQYTQPKFRVIAGRYFTKLEAQKDLMSLRRIFPNAILVPEKIMIR